MEDKQVITYPNGTFTATKWMCDGILIGHGLSSFRELFASPAHSDNDVIRLHFGLRGDYLFTYQQLGKTYDLIGGHHNFMYSVPFDMVVENKTLELEIFGVQFPREQFLSMTQHGSDHLKRFADKVAAGQPVIFTETWGALDSQMEQVISQIRFSKYAGDFQRLFLLSKSLELLVLSAESCMTAAEREPVFLKNKQDAEKIIAVRDLINTRLDSPPSLTEIARTVGLNEYKLKRGFKEKFNNTVFGYLTDQRLHLAHQYLRDTGKTAAEISAELGYATPQHFNNAFKKKFGFTPYSVRNNP
ncbi:helix-turn-helix domain-containing protein [Chitinophaga qingshengii]|uniref:Helix-turn-helix transcriptional regulator n=1 Tax=Chitinophaga qingshengii TaxID=1569794 RepID=A0ABR7TL53_9BACT|nr:AraC family transcriptional regulator [Chitinophaga qingshengii]MBC9931222.1 helix-turn-helix transcriptional regulator [Chitinophaga qingshengii]